MPRYLRNLVIGLIVIGVLYGLDFVFQAGLINPYYSRILMLCGISITLAVSLNLINGFTGQFSIGHAGFMAVGAYSSAYFSVTYGMNLADSLGGGKLGWVVALALSTIVGAAMAGVAGLAVGIPSLRLRGDYLAIVTLGFGQIIVVFLNNIEAVGGALLAHFDGYLNPKSFEFIKSFEILIMIILGGLGSIVGSVLGAIVLTILPEGLRGFAEYRMVIYSLLLIILMITRPQGLLGSTNAFKGFRKRLRRVTEGPSGPASSATQSETSLGSEKS